VLTRLDACVAYERHWTNSLDEPADNAHGLSVWFPQHSAGVDYQATAFAQDTGWHDFLSAMVPYFRSPGRIESAYWTSAIPADSDDNGLLDSLDLAFGSPGNGTVETSVYGPSGSLYAGSILPSGGNLSESLGDVGWYQAEFLLWDWNGQLVNQSYFGEGLAREETRTLSGQVKSDSGRGIRWVGVELLDPEGRRVASAMTDSQGRYAMEVTVPTQTDGSNMTLECAVGQDRQNVSVGSLPEHYEHDFSFTTGGEHAQLLSVAALVLDIAALVLLAAWVVGRSRKPAGKGQPPDGENVLGQQHIPPQ
jgi:hypothetical protein